MTTLSEDAKKKQGSKFAGDFVLENQKTGEGFSHVSKIWLDKTMSFDEMLKKGREFQARCKDIEGLNLSNFVSENAALFVRKEKGSNKASRIEVSEHSRRQMSSFLGLPAEYLSFLQKEDYSLFDRNFNAAVDRAILARDQYDRKCDEAVNSKTPKPERPAHMDREVFLRTVATPDGAVLLRAMLSSKYAVINNLPVIETIADIIPGGRVSHLHYDGDTLRANILVPDCLRTEDDSDYGGGISLLNNETGRFMYRSRPFVFRAICQNGLIWDRKDGFEFNRRHIGTINWVEFRKAIVLNIQKQIPLLQGNIDKVLALKGIPVTQSEIEQAIVYLGRREGLTQGVTKTWYYGFKVELGLAKTASQILTAFGLIQGATRASQTQEFETQELMETMSARLVDQNWDKSMTAARAEVSADEAKEFFAV